MPDFWEDRLRQALGVDEVGADGPRSVADVDPKRWHESVRICRDELGCDFFDWLSAVDEGPDMPQDAADSPVGTEPSGPHRFRIVAHLWSVAERRGVLLRAMLTEGAIASVTDLYPGADWHERETHEMFGVDFPGHPDLKPLLLAPEFEGHPLRKDFVLASRVVKPWPGAKEPGEGHGTARKRAPKRPPGVPEDWIQPETQAEPEPPATETAPVTASQPETASAPEIGPRPETAPDPGSASDAPDPRTRRPDAP
jgi:NADH-quinone oxidoreductase subunit C